VEFNLVSGELDVKKEYEDCDNPERMTQKSENEILFQKNILITFQNRHESEVKIITPKYNHEIYIAIPQE
jgi:hypothetical protein